MQVFQTSNSLGIKSEFIMRPKSDSQWWERGLQGNATQQHSSSPDFCIQLLFIRQLWECLTFVNSSLSPSCCEWRCWRASQFLKARHGEEFNSESTTATLDLLIIFGTLLQDDAMLTLKYTDFNSIEAAFWSRNGRLDPSSHLERSYLIGVPKDNWGGLEKFKWPQLKHVISSHNSTICDLIMALPRISCCCLISFKYKPWEMKFR